MSAQGDRRVAVIGAGISGVCAAAHLLKFGVSVKLLERSDVAGGVWHFDKTSAHDPPYPSTQPSKGDYTKYDAGDPIYDTPPRTPDSDSRRSSDHSLKSYAQDAEEIRIAHAPPGPCYSSLRNNVPLTLMKSSLLQWPAELEEFVGHEHIEEYIRRLSKTSGVEEMTEYNTRVENVTKDGEVWKVSTATLHHNASLGISQISLQTRDFDAVVVATGHYQMPRVPDISGLKNWKERYPTRIRHSKTYRSADGFANQEVLLIGSGVSSCDVAKDLASKDAKVYQSSRGGVLELPTTFLPESAVRVGPVKSFTMCDVVGYEDLKSADDAIPGYVTLQNGSKLHGLHQVILATGYITSYPFLSQLHSDLLPRELAGDHTLVTSEGDMVHNLHRDIFYIEDPTLSFVGVPYHNATFSLFDFQAQIVARHLAGLLTMPSRPDMRAEYETRVRVKGLGRDFHSLRDPGEEIAYVQDLVDWANRDASNIRCQSMVGHTEEWLKAYKAQKERIKFLVGTRRAVSDATKYDHVVVLETKVCS